MKKIDVSFLIVTFNQDVFIFQTLESVKYQIEKYGNNRTFQLIVADDASTDETVNKIDFWIKKNNKLFYSIDLIFRKNNIGTCNNYVEAFKRVKGIYFKEMGGDDLLPGNNLLELFDKLNEFDILSTVALQFQEKELIINDFAFNKKVFMQNFYTFNELKKIIQIDCPIQNGAIWKKDLMTKTVLEEISKYSLIEDRAQWNAIFSENNDLTYGYVNTPGLLWRKNNRSVTGVNSPAMKIYQDDLKKYFMRSRKKCKNLLFKILVCINYNMILFPTLKLINPYTYKMKIKTIKYFKERNEMMKKIHDSYLRQSEKYLDEIVKKAETLEIEFKDEKI